MKDIRRWSPSKAGRETWPTSFVITDPTLWGVIVFSTFLNSFLLVSKIWLEKNAFAPPRPDSSRFIANCAAGSAISRLKQDTPCPQKKLEVCFLAISQLLLGQIQKVRSVLKTTGSENLKTVLTFEIWPSRGWDTWG